MEREEEKLIEESHKKRKTELKTHASQYYYSHWIGFRYFVFRGGIMLFGLLKSSLALSVSFCAVEFGNIYDIITMRAIHIHVSQ